MRATSPPSMGDGKSEEKRARADEEEDEELTVPSWPPRMAPLARWPTVISAAGKTISPLLPRRSSSVSVSRSGSAAAAQRHSVSRPAESLRLNDQRAQPARDTRIRPIPRAIASSIAGAWGPPAAHSPRPPSASPPVPISLSLSLSLSRSLAPSRGSAMADYHFVYKDVEGATTQWDDIQRKLGNLPEKPEPFKPPPFAPRVDADEQPRSKEWLDARDPDELEELEDDLDDDRFLEQYRRMRLAELKEAAKTARFGTIQPITGSDFVREVSQAPPDVWVVVFLYKDAIPECGLLETCLEELATKYAETKFVKIISTDCIPNYPDRNVPTILVYNNSAVKGTYVGLQKFGGKKCTPESVALALCHSDPVLNDGQGGGDSSRNNVMEGVRRKFIEKVVSQLETREDEDDSD